MPKATKPQTRHPHLCGTKAVKTNQPTNPPHTTITQTNKTQSQISISFTSLFHFSLMTVLTIAGDLLSFQMHSHPSSMYSVLTDVWLHLPSEKDK